MKAILVLPIALVILLSVFDLAVAAKWNLGQNPSRVACPSPLRHAHCPVEDVVVRKEWYVVTFNVQTMNTSRLITCLVWDCHSDEEKLDFINSIKCLMRLPPKTPSSAAPGARSRYDDFLLIHINSTFSVHINGPFLTWHRRLVFLFERALRDECGYNGHLPFMYWPRHACNLSASSIFNGSPTSMGGDGYFNASNPSVSNGNYTPPLGRGDGCTASGPFTNLTTHFRYFPAVGTIFSLPADTLDYNPHCVRRNLNSGIMSNSNSEFAIERLLSEPNITAFQQRIDSVFLPGGSDTGDYGIHAGGHGSVGGDMTDFFASPADPKFWLHHTMVDLVWTIWQARDPPNRQYALNGTNIMFNDPAGTEVTVDFEQDFGYLDHPWRLGDLMDVRKRPYNYRYQYRDEH